MPERMARRQNGNSMKVSIGDFFTITWVCWAGLTLLVVLDRYPRLTDWIMSDAEQDDQ